jgi:hypothetical protein
MAGDLGVGDQVVAEVGRAHRVDVVVGDHTELVLDLRRMSWHFFLMTPGAGPAWSIEADLG